LVIITASWASPSEASKLDSSARVIIVLTIRTASGALAASASQNASV